MNNIKKFHYQLVSQVGIITWCWILIVLFLGLIIILESQWNNLGGWFLIFLSLIAILLQWQQHILIIDSQQQILIIHSLFNSNQHRFQFSQIKKIKFHRHRCIFYFHDKSYFPLQLLLSKKGVLQLQFLNSGCEKCEK